MKSVGDQNVSCVASAVVPLESETSTTAPQLRNLSISIPLSVEVSTEEPGPRVKVAKRMHSDLTSSDGSLSQEQLDMLKKDSRLTEYLKDASIRAQIYEILDAANDSEALLSRMLDSQTNFAAFVQTMLHHIGLRDAEGVSTL